MSMPLGCMGLGSFLFGSFVPPGGVAFSEAFWGRFFRILCPNGTARLRVLFVVRIFWIGVVGVRVFVWAVFGIGFIGIGILVHGIAHAHPIHVPSLRFLRLRLPGIRIVCLVGIVVVLILALFGFAILRLLLIAFFRVEFLLLGLVVLLLFVFALALGLIEILLFFHCLGSGEKGLLRFGASNITALHIPILNGLCQVAVVNRFHPVLDCQPCFGFEWRSIGIFELGEIGGIFVFEIARPGFVLLSFE